mmetsp:Transcript_21981/g.72906  ORF Transcript_21981/g.72906 Transcript_21981/m.72906 type:complete len:225 (-) Transcript_21981:883-1557(-)
MQPSSLVPRSPARIVDSFAAPSISLSTYRVAHSAPDSRHVGRRIAGVCVWGGGVMHCCPRGTESSQVALEVCAVLVGRGAASLLLLTHGAQLRDRCDWPAGALVSGVADQPADGKAGEADCRKDAVKLCVGGLLLCLRLRLRGAREVAGGGEKVDPLLPRQGVRARCRDVCGGKRERVGHEDETFRQALGGHAGQGGKSSEERTHDDTQQVGEGRVGDQAQEGV